MQAINPFRHPIVAIMALILLAAQLPASPLIQAAHAMRVPQPHWTHGAALLYALAAVIFYAVLCVVSEAGRGSEK